MSFTFVLLRQSLRLLLGSSRARGVIEASKLPAIFERFSFQPIWARLMLVCSLALLGLANPLAAQDGAAGDPEPEVFFGNEHIGLELVADGPPVAGEEWLLALHFTPDTLEWHGYWSNPGDAGLGMALDWQLPDGWSVGEALYPVPKRLVIADLMNHVYEGDYTVLVPVNIPANADVAADLATIAAPSLFANYLACTDEICVPQDAQLTLDPASAGDDARFDGWRANIAPLLDSAATYELTSDALNLAIPLPSALDLADPHVFIETIDLVSYAAEQSFSRDGNTLFVSIPLGAAIPPKGVSGIVSFGGADGESGPSQGVRFTASQGQVALSGEPMQGSMRELPSAWLALLGALIGGLLLNIMPCVFPILSLKALSLAKAGGDEGAARRDAIAYTAGVVLACVALGGLLLALRAAGEQVGWAFQLQSPSVVVALFVLAAVITANFAGVFELPSFSMTRGGGGQSSGGWSSSFGTGLLAAIAATPCTGPFMAAAMGAALLLPIPIALGLFAALGFGLALPFLVLGFVPALRNLLPKPGAWMERFRRWMALPMGLTTLALIWLIARLGGQGFALIALLLTAGIVIALFVVGRLQQKGKMAWPAFGLIAAPFLVFAAFALPASYSSAVTASSASIHDPASFSEEALENARAQGKPVFLWFTADWCLTCKVNERVAIEQEQTRAAFEKAGVVTMRGDWTRRDEAITRFLTAQGAAGVPLYLYYPAGSDTPETLPQVLTPDLLAELAQDQQAP